MGEDLGLAGARPGHHQQRAGIVGDGLTLDRVQVGEQVCFGGHALLSSPVATSTRARALIALGIAFASLAVRAPTLDRALTIDESLWVERSARFVDAVGDLRFREAIETGHPGVTTMWVAGLAQRTLPRDAELRDRYERARLGMGVASTALIVLIWWLAGMLFGAGVAAVAGFLLALDPFLLAHNRVLHLDGLLALLMVASTLALMAALRSENRKLLLLSGALGGLSFLTKQPAVYLLLVVGVILWREGGGIRGRFLRWLAPAAVVVVALWPVLWVRPWHAAAMMLGGGSAAITETTSSGFFLGRQVEDPGPLFYPVALAIRSSELILPAGLATIVWAIRRRRDEPARSVLKLLAFGLGFLVLMSLAPKKGDRYGLPALVALDVGVAVSDGGLPPREGAAYDRSRGCRDDVRPRRSRPVAPSVPDLSFQSGHRRSQNRPRGDRGGMGRRPRRGRTRPQRDARGRQVDRRDDADHAVRGLLHRTNRAGRGFRRS